MFSSYTNLDSLQAFNKKQNIEKRDANFLRWVMHQVLQMNKQCLQKRVTKAIIQQDL